MKFWDYFVLPGPGARSFCNVHARSATCSPPSRGSCLRIVVTAGDTHGVVRLARCAASLVRSRYRRQISTERRTLCAEVQCRQALFEERGGAGAILDRALRAPVPCTPDLSPRPLPQFVLCHSAFCVGLV